MNPEHPDREKEVAPITQKKVLRPLRPLYLFLYAIAYCLAEALIRLVYPVFGYGRKNLPKYGYVLAPNHLSAIDPLFVLMARWQFRKMLVMSKEELFEISPVVNFLWAVFGAFPIDRGAGDRGTIEQAMREVKGEEGEKGRGLLIFPEGTRSKDGNLGRLKSGAFVVAMEAGVPMVPCRISYRAGGPKPFRRVTVVFGKPVTPEAMGLVGEYSPKKLREAKTIFTQKLEELHAEYADKL